MTAVPDPSAEPADATELVDRTIRIDRATRPARPSAAPADEPADETVIAARRRGGPAAAVAPADDEPPDDTVRGSARAGEAPVRPEEPGPVRAPQDAASPSAPPILRAAYSPDAAALRTGYAAREAAPAAVERASPHPRAPHAPADAHEVDRSIRARARRRLVWVGVAIAVTLVVVVGLLVALVASFGA